MHFCTFFGYTEPPTPQKIPSPSVGGGGGMDIFWNCTIKVLLYLHTEHIPGTIWLARERLNYKYIMITAYQPRLTITMLLPSVPCGCNTSPVTTATELGTEDWLAYTLDGSSLPEFVKTCCCANNRPITSCSVELIGWPAMWLTDTGAMSLGSAEENQIVLKNCLTNHLRSRILKASWEECQSILSINPQLTLHHNLSWHSIDILFNSQLRVE